MNTWASPVSQKQRAKAMPELRTIKKRGERPRWWSRERGQGLKIIEILILVFILVAVFAELDVGPFVLVTKRLLVDLGVLW